ncbi:MAG TPA: acyl carrier protein [Anaeromyxobacteraceae bacterium]|nr:acyl carrier protein [Anaeromyxobacteraceae bacterium]
MDIRVVLREFIERNFWVRDGVGDDNSLLDSGILDSTGLVEVVTFLESRFEIAIADTEIIPENFETIARMSAFVARRTGTDERADEALRRVGS